MNASPRASVASMLVSLLGSIVLCPVVAAQGAVYADGVRRYIPEFSGGAVATGLVDPAAALGKPDFVALPASGFVSLGCGGLLEVVFSGAQVSNDGGPDGDLQVIEVGGDPEPLAVWVLPADAATELALAAAIPNSDGFYFLGTSPGGKATLDLDFLAPESEPGTLRFNVVRLVDQDFLGAPSRSAGADVDAVRALAPAAPIHQTNTPAASLEVLGVRSTRYPLKVEANVDETPLFRLEVGGPPNRPFLLALSPAGLLEGPGSPSPAVGLVDLDLRRGLTILMDGVTFGGALGLDDFANTGPDGRAVIEFPMPPVAAPMHLGGLQALVRGRDGTYTATAATDVTLVSAPADAIYVAADFGNDAHPGTRERPKASIREGVAAASWHGISRVKVAAGTYDEDPGFMAGVTVTGGWVPGPVWTKPPTSWSEIVKPVRITDLAPGSIDLSGFRFAPPTPATPGASAIAVVVDRSPEVTFQNCRFVPGAGARGADGPDGDDAFTPPGWAAHGGPGGRGGDAPGERGQDGIDGRTSSAANPGRHGAGGSGSAGGNAGDGGRGEDGANGEGGDAADVAPLYANEGAPDLTAGDGLAGEDGTSGSGAGGGGGGGATVANRRVLRGGHGGAGGYGGRPGRGGAGGQGGGASVGVAIFEASPTFADCFFRAGRGGDGGPGGRGGTGQLGGVGDRGGRGQSSGSVSAGDGGDGGRGGTGGPGAGGGGGAGGASFSIFRARNGLEVFLGSLNQVSRGRGGMGGRGGAARGLDGIAASPGVDGPAGESASAAVR